jgi:hypothetical protein
VSGRRSRLLPELTGSPEGGVVLGALMALLAHPEWSVVAEVAGALVNVAGDPTGEGAAALQ